MNLLKERMRSNTVHIDEEKKRSLLIGQTTFYSFYDYNLKEQDLIKAHKELKEEEHRKTEYLRRVKEKLAEDKQLVFSTDDDFLLRYLRYKKFDCEKACKAIRTLYSIKKNYPEYFSLTPRLRSCLNSGFVKFLPYREDGGPLIIMTDFRKFNLDENSLLEMMQLTTVACDMITVNPHAQINGAIGVYDFRGLSFRHLAQVVHPSIFLPLSSILQDIYPWRLKHVLAIHCTKLFRTLYAAIKPVMKNKVKERVTLLGANLSELHKFVNPVLLPKEYGGTLEEIDSRMADITMDNLSYLEYQRSFGYASNQ